MSLLDPIPPADVPHRNAVGRLGDLAGRVIGLRVEWANFALLCDAIEPQLAAAREIRRWTLVRERLLADGAVDWLPRRETELAMFADGIDAAVVGLADGGSSTYWNVEDWAELQQRGIPAVLVVTDAYRAQAQALAALRGYQGLRMVSLPHPFHALSPERVVSLAPAVGREILELL